MSVSSKWWVSRIEGNTVSLHPVCRGVENREWASSTPGGSATMIIQNEAALQQFEVGKEYAAVWVEVPKPAPRDGHAVVPVTLKSFEGTPSEKTVYLCGTCGSYARLNDDDTPNWTAHEEMFGTSTSG